ncbi:MAG: right-handed parallel beta-helix repeat-containing protein [Phycisphaeraceae bacterium]|nr:right-handed parallel beta-helix repeat-containing protein [Phycisphaeraceae bacterium]
MKQRISSLCFTLSLCLGLLSSAVTATGDMLFDTRSGLRARQVSFVGDSFASYIEGNAPSVRLVLDGTLFSDMFMHVLVWDQSRAATSLTFKQVLTGDPKPNGSYLISRSKLNALPPGNYLMQVKLYQVSSNGVVVVSMLQQSFTVQIKPPAEPQEPAAPPTVDPDPDPTPEEPPVVIPDEPLEPDDTVLPEEPEEPEAPDEPDTPDVQDVPQEPAPPQEPNDPPPTNAVKQVVWNLAPQDGQTYRDLTLRGGVRAVWQSVNDVTFIDCDFRDAAVLLTVQARDDGSDASRNWRFVRCTFVGATRDDWGHSHGAFLQGVDNFVFSDCTFSGNGWLGRARFNQNHNVYLLDVGAVTFTGCTFDRAAAQGVKGLGYRRLEVSDCTFSGNLIDIGSDDRSASGYLIVRNSRFYNTGGVDSIGLTIGWSLALEHYNNDLNSILIQDCQWFAPAVDNNVWAMKFAGGRVRSAQVIGCDLRQWKVNTSVWPKIVNHIGGRLTIKDTILD